MTRLVYDSSNPQHRALLDSLTRLCFTRKAPRGQQWDRDRTKYPMETISGPLSQEDIADSLQRNGFDLAEAGLNKIGRLLRKLTTQWGDPQALCDAYVVGILQEIHVQALPPVSQAYTILAELYEAYAAIATPPPLLEYLTSAGVANRGYGEGQQ